MPIEILITVISVTLIQSVFGVGILLFGTPILLLLNYDFITTLSILLPISIAINSLQVIKHYAYIDLKFYQALLRFTLPSILVSLLLITYVQININLIVGAFLLFVALKNVSPQIEIWLNQLMRYEKSYLISMGIVHGLTNLGGSLLTAVVYHKEKSKHTTRVTIALCYASFAIIQLFTLFLIGDKSSRLFSYADSMTLLQLAIIVFLIAEETLYQAIERQKYQQFFSVFLAISGILLFLK